jgi:hypothetical protein
LTYPGPRPIRGRRCCSDLVGTEPPRTSRVEAPGHRAARRDSSRGDSAATGQAARDLTYQELLWRRRQDYPVAGVLDIDGHLLAVARDLPNGPAIIRRVRYTCLIADFDFLAHFPLHEVGVRWRVGVLPDELVDIRRPGHTREPALEHHLGNSGRGAELGVQDVRLRRVECALPADDSKNSIAAATAHPVPGRVGYPELRARRYAREQDLFEPTTVSPTRCRRSQRPEPDRVPRACRPQRRCRRWRALRRMPIL